MKPAARAYDRMVWLLREVAACTHGIASTTDAELVNRFIERYPYAAVTTEFHHWGAHHCKLLGATFRKAWHAGLVRPGICSHGGDIAGMKSWSRTWQITELGKRLLESIPQEEP